MVADDDRVGHTVLALEHVDGVGVQDHPVAARYGAVLPDLARFSARIEEVVDTPERTRRRLGGRTSRVVERTARRLRDILRAVGVVDRRGYRVLVAAAQVVLRVRDI